MWYKPVRKMDGETQSLFGSVAAALTTTLLCRCPALAAGQVEELEDEGEGEGAAATMCMGMAMGTGAPQILRTYVLNLRSARAP